MQKKKYLNYPFIILSLLLGTVFTEAQVREFRIHDRGMLHETVYNTGDIGRGWMTGQAGNITTTPLMEWPSRSATIVDNIKYSGQHNILGGGMYMAANLQGKPGKENRIYSLCGGVGASSPETVYGRWSFPISIEKIENYPLQPDGTVNPAYNPDEAEEIIIARWASSLGVTVTRTSRAYSYPDYDDFIIYEYELEYTGDTDGDPSTIERDSVLTDFMALFIYGFAPSMYGYQRHYQEWKYDSGIYRGDQNGFWDADYWLAFNLNLRTNITDDKLWAKPEPNIDLFYNFAQTGKNGGGLCSPQAPGFMVLYYDTNHLAVVDPNDPNRNESEVVDVLRTNNGEFYELDENNHIKQPWSNKVSTGNTRSSKMKDQSINPDKRWSGVYSPSSVTWPAPPSTEWYGRAAYNYRQSVDAGQKHIVFGPYTLHPGDKLEYSLAEVVGYGAAPGKVLEGGQVIQQWAPTPSWNRKIVKDGQTLTEHYLDEYGYPDYVNSEVRFVQQVAHKALEAYLGQQVPYDSIGNRPAGGPIWPESMPKDGVYTVPVTLPAPVLKVENTEIGAIRLTWNREVESFTHPRLSGPLQKFYILRSNAGMGPWTILDSLEVGQVNDKDRYEFLDTDSTFKIGETRFYAVTSVDASGIQGAKTNITRHSKNIGSVEKMKEVFVAPNPFIIESGFGGAVGAENQIGFYGLPRRCTIRIYSYAGQLIKAIEHNDPVYSTEWFQVSRNEQEIASGIYFYVVTSPDGDKKSGKFIIVK